MILLTSSVGGGLSQPSMNRRSGKASRNLGIRDRTPLRAPRVGCKDAYEVYLKSPTCLFRALAALPIFNDIYAAPVRQVAIRCFCSQFKE